SKVGSGTFPGGGAGAPVRATGPQTAVTRSPAKRSASREDATLGHGTRHIARRRRWRACPGYRTTDGCDP
ncbi:hypothetical protein, partial [Klebsiella michiganensis]|uniref:hypothetical protein n=1 Tax=Klebsiella michiganensis TaxID=1134687 RepID=UPI0035E21181